MLKILYAYGIKQSIIYTISTLHENTHARVLTPNVETDTFKITSGTRRYISTIPLCYRTILCY